ncbi:uncharacterized protein Z518_05800 [Rhinocladiella mackenziei CBS 650.93]|uniref:Uncharacterized protein n=1 Tax=Rhinocladiella mackenziei CBS 650.93 TaxID=1442369 RepID=A0A0D2IGP6_9EURO|nr:uncharacterized protein Z518_05800 [Rhinocladiella mackenziei CBS 650.93]KIX04929.1 hypothetical protein Z518_05800 [Rhinocladiella mackenziei CBS 650.93]
MSVRSSVLQELDTKSASYSPDAFIIPLDIDQDFDEYYDYVDQNNWSMKFQKAASPDRMTVSSNETSPSQESERDLSSCATTPSWSNIPSPLQFQSWHSAVLSAQTPNEDPYGRKKTYDDDENSSCRNGDAAIRSLFCLETSIELKGNGSEGVPGSPRRLQRRRDLHFSRIRASAR